jgi:lipoate-protein ligase A
MRMDDKLLDVRSMNVKKAYKVPDGKLVKISMDLDNEIIKSVKITGDFFIHPEDSLEDLEKDLLDLQLGTREIKTVIQEYFNREDVEVYGITSDALIYLISTMNEEG